MYQKIKTTILTNGTTSLDYEGSVERTGLDESMAHQRELFALSIGIKSVEECPTTLIAVYEQGTTVVMNWTL